MTIAFWCVLAGALMPLLWTAYAKFTGAGFRPRDNYNPREFLEALEGARKRAHWAQLNSFEAFPPFAAAVVVNHLAGGGGTTVDLLALAWVGLRLAYGALYIADRASLRSLAWFLATACWVAIFVAAA